MSKLQPYGRNRADSKRKIQRILDNLGKNFTDVAKAAEVSPQAVCTWNGSRIVRAFLTSCPLSVDLRRMESGIVMATALNEA